jgi:protein-S-isoprenylcysteine O-methyltransferase Ste14
MNREMKIAGVAPLIAGPTFVYMILTIIVSSFENPFFSMTKQNREALNIIGIILILLGIMMVISCARKLLNSFNSNLLMTDGLYKIFRNPMYAAYLLFIIPGICLLFNSWLVLTTIIINYILFTIFIRREHTYLQDKFGKEYEKYLEKVLIKFL